MARRGYGVHTVQELVASRAVGCGEIKLFIGCRRQNGGSGIGAGAIERVGVSHPQGIPTGHIQDAILRDQTRGTGSHQIRNITEDTSISAGLGQNDGLQIEAVSISHRHSNGLNRVRRGVSPSIGQGHKNISAYQI